MGDLSNYFKRFFDSKKPKENNVPFLHEAIDLKSFPYGEVEKWKFAGGYHEFSELINKAFRDYYFNKDKQIASQSITILDTSHSNGWFLQCAELIFLDLGYKYFANVLSTKLKDQGYIIQLAESKSTTTNEGIEMITHYYLKPSLRNRKSSHQKLSSQLYGNISIKYTTINGSPKSFKFLAKSYNDSNYLPPLAFSDLNNILFSD